MTVQPSDLPGYGRFDRSIPVYPVLESRPLVVWTDRDGNEWLPTTRTNEAGERVLECPAPLDPDDQSEGDSFPWTYRSVDGFFGPLSERRMGGAS